MEQQFKQKVAMITGGGSGIGRAAALAFAREGSRVAVADITEEGGNETVRLVESAGGTARFFKVNVTRSDQVQALITGIVSQWGRLDITLNNAGVNNDMKPIVETSEAEFDRVMAVNVKGVWLCMKHAIPQMLAQGGGVIINTASALSLTVLPGSSPYNGSKHAVAGITKTCAVEYGAKNIRINAICPGVIRTPLLENHPNLPELEASLLPLHPIGRLGTVEEVADVILWLASDRASFVHGALVTVNGGWTAQ